MSGTISPPPHLANDLVGVAIISKGRPEVLNDTLESLSRQTHAPHQVVVVTPTEADLPSKKWEAPVQYIVGFNGGCIQRNKAIEAIPTFVDYVAFFDDDFELKPDFLAEAVRFMKGHPEVIGFSGLVIADGKINRQEAREKIAQYAYPSDPNGHFRSTGKLHSLYGCNMFIRRAILEQEKFDENLSLYSFAEDYDLSVRLERYGLVGKYSRCVGVHLAVPGGRVREVQRGYAFVANPWYFLKKGVTHRSPFMSLVRFWVVCVGKNCWLSIWKILTGDRSLDWAGRLHGSLLAVKDILLGRSQPNRVEKI